MSTDSHDPTTDLGGEPGMGDLDRVWDALELIAERVDERAEAAHPAIVEHDETLDEQGEHDGAAAGSL